MIKLGKTSRGLTAVLIVILSYIPFAVLKAQKFNESVPPPLLKLVIKCLWIGRYTTEHGEESGAVILPAY